MEKKEKICSTCNKPIGIGPWVIHAGEIFHAACYPLVPKKEPKRKRKKKGGKK